MKGLILNSPRDLKRGEKEREFAFSFPQKRKRFTSSSRRSRERGVLDPFFRQSQQKKEKEKKSSAFPLWGPWGKGRASRSFLFPQEGGGKECGFLFL